MNLRLPLGSTTCSAGHMPAAPSVARLSPARASRSRVATTLTRAALFVVAILSLATMSTPAQESSGQQASTREPVELTLDAAIERALEADERVENTLLDIRRAEAAYATSRYSRLPALTLSAGYERTREMDPPTLSLPEQLGGGQELGEAVPDRYSVHARLRQEIFTGFARAADIAARDAEINAASHRRSHTTAQVTLAATELFYAAVLADARVEGAERSLERARETRRESEDLLDEGLATRNEVLRARMGESEAEGERSRAENARSRSHLRLSRALGLEPGENISLQYELDHAPAGRSATGERDGSATGASDADTAAVDSPDPADAVEEALRSRSDLAAAGARIDAAEERIRQARSALYPRLAASAQVLHARPNPAVFPVEDKFETTWNIGLELSFNVGGIPAARSRTEEARLAREQARLDYDRTTDDITLEVRERALDVEDAAERIRNARIMTEQAQENVRVTQDMHDEGLARFSELLEARELASRAELLLLEARVGLRLAEARYEFAKGGGID